MAVPEAPRSTRCSARPAATCTRFDLDFDLPDHFIPEFPAPIYPDHAGPISATSPRGSWSRSTNFYELFKRHPEPEAARGPAPAGHAVSAAAVQRDDDRPAPEKPEPGRRLLRLPRQRAHQHRHPPRRRHSAAASSGTASTPRRCAASNIQRLFGSQRALKTVEDFTEFEQRAAYFDGDIAASPPRRGSSPLDRGQPGPLRWPSSRRSLDFPPAPKLGARTGASRSREGQRRGAARRRSVLRQGPVRDAAIRRRITPTT